MARRPATPSNRLHDIRRAVLKKRDYMTRTKTPSAERVHLLLIDTLRLLSETIDVVAEIEKNTPCEKPSEIAR